MADAPGSTELCCFKRQATPRNEGRGSYGRTRVQGPRFSFFVENVELIVCDRRILTKWRA